MGRREPDLEFGAVRIESASEAARLANVAAWYDPFQDFDLHACRYGAGLIRRNAVAGNCLEVGCGTGAQTLALLDAFDEVDALDGSEQNIERTGAAVMEALEANRSASGAIRFFPVLAEEFDPGAKRYANIVMTHFLEHVASPVALLRHYASFLSDGGAIHVTVPNAASLHREVGVAMGMLSKPTALSERDVKIGHRRVYTESLLRRHIRQAGLCIDVVEGILLKPLSNAQMETFDSRLVEALFAVGRRHPRICAEIYVRCRRRVRA
jgi:2-polyprenyl-3-methyl-5-hydroxy-6-metoxy-1,4-benzoquinol methylase